MMKAREIMTEDVATVRGSATLAEAAKLMKLKGLRSLVVDRRHDEDAYGLVTESDIINKVVAFGKDLNQVRVYEVMTKPCVVVNPDLGLEYVARLFAQTGIDRAPVIQGELLGIISVTDILFNGDFLDNPRVALLNRAIEQAVAAARTISNDKGSDSQECAAAWEVVAELEAELAHLSSVVPAKSAFAQFCEEQAAPQLATA